MLPKLLLIGKILVVVAHHISTRLHVLLSQQLHRLTYRAVEHPRNVVVIGASFAGYHATRCLATSLPTGYRVVVIEKHTHFHFTWVLPRFSVIPGHQHKAFIPYGSYLGSAPTGSWEWKTDTVQRIVPGEKGDNGMVELESGESVEYEYLVIATGASAGLPSRVAADGKQEGMDILESEQEKLRVAKDVVVIGGGAVGIELAADAKARYPEKNVTLVHSRNRLLNVHYGDKLGETALGELETLGVNVHLGERATLDAKTQCVRLGSGEVIPCDYQVNCVGQRPNSALINCLSPTSVSELGHVRVRPTLQIEDPVFSHIYAAGDVIQSGGVRNARGAIEQAQVVSENIVRSIHSKEQIEYHPRWWEGMTKLTLGLNKSVIWMGDGTSEITMSVKSRREELDSAEVWKFLGVKPYEDTGL